MVDLGFLEETGRVLFLLLFIEKYFFLLPHHEAFKILVPQPGIKPVPREAQNLNYWTTRVVPRRVLKGFSVLKVKAPGPTAICPHVHSVVSDCLQLCGL